MIMVLLIVVAVGWVALEGYNRIIRQTNMVKEAWSGIDVQLKRRHDLIPNIVQSVEGYARHERAVMEAIASLRAQPAIGEQNVLRRGESESGTSQSLRALFAVVENYPDLKANRNFLHLQRTLIDIEDHLQMARRYYNGTVRDFNILIGSFPWMMVAQVLHTHPQEFFEIEYATQRSVPEVKFES